MIRELYTKRPLWTHTYVASFAAYPALYVLLSKPHSDDSEVSLCAISMMLWGLAHSFLFFSSFWGFAMYRISCLSSTDDPDRAEVVFVSTDRGEMRGKKSGMAHIRTQTLLINGEKTLIRYFEFDKDVFYLSDGKVAKVEVCTAHMLSAYVEATGQRHRPAKEYAKPRPCVQEMLYRHGVERVLTPKNEFRIDPPTFAKMFSEHAVSPFFVFQIFCAVLWMLDEYWKYSLFTFLTVIFFDGCMVFQRLVNIRQLRSLNLQPQIIKKHGEKEETVLSTDLLPGDIIDLTGTTSQIPADLLLLRGSVVVSESMLSGEETPVQKEEVVSAEETLSFQKHRKHILFGGTRIIKTSPGQTLCLVLRTGFMTEQGSLIKAMISSEDAVSENNLEAYAFILVMLLFALAACGYVARASLGMGKSVYKTLLECVMILTNVVPPELPMELTIAVNSALQDLVGLGVYCLEPFRIPFAGKVSLCCFDKTGTLTELAYELAKIKKASADARMVLGTAHSCVVVDGKVQGDPLDVCSMEYVGAEIPDSGAVCVDGSKFLVLKTYAFDSGLSRVTSVLRDLETGQHHVVMKGAPETVQKYLAEVPEVYVKYTEYASRGYKVLAAASRPVSAKGLKEIRDSGEPPGELKRSLLEKDMVFCGFVLYSSKLKKGARDALKHLAQSNHKVVMITGDNELTAISVARKLDMFNGVSVTGTKEIDRFVKETSLEARKRRPGTGCASLKWPSVFARATPAAKEKLVSLMNEMGEYTLMCGDGTNDVGALKKAHVGVALLEETKTKAKSISLPGNIGQSMFILDEEVKTKLGDASIAAPFTSRTGSLRSVVDVISRGRSALVSTIQMYKVLALNSLLSAYTLSVFDAMGVRYGDFQMTAMGLLSAFSFTFFGKARPLPRLSREKPVARIFSRYIVSSVVLQTISHVLSFYLVYICVAQYGSIVYQEKFSPTLANSAMFLLSTGLQSTTLIVNYVGRPFREGLVENRKLFASLLATLGIVAACTLEVSEDLNAKMELVPLPPAVKHRLLLVLAADFLVCFAVEKAAFQAFVTERITPKRTKKE